MIFPSLRTGIPIRYKDLAATFEAKSCIGKVILSIRTEGIGIIKIKKTRGKRSVLKYSFPKRKRIIPPRTAKIENLMVKYSVARFPNRRSMIPKSKNAKPIQLLERLKAESSFRLS